MATENKDAYYDPSHANMLKAKKDAKKNRKRADWDIPGTTPRGAASIGPLMKVALYKKFCHFAKLSSPPDGDNAIQLLEGGEEKEAPAEKSIKVGHLFSLVKDCGETSMPVMPIEATEEGFIFWSTFLRWWQLGQKHLEDVYSDDD